LAEVDATELDYILRLFKVRVLTEPDTDNKNDKGLAELEAAGF
jgi:hypothetical protein